MDRAPDVCAPQVSAPGQLARVPLTPAEIAARRAAGMPDPAALLVVAYGMGWDSTALLVEFTRLGVHPDKILFADTGVEKPETYAYLPVIQQFLRDHGMVPVEVVRKIPKRVKYTTLEEQCLHNRTLPSLAYGHKKCSLTWKREPQDQHCNRWPVAQRAWKRGERLVKVIGYDAGPKDMRRADIEDDDKYVYWYPLRVWGWDRERCGAEILAVGLPLPPKSSCWCCPAMKPEEVADLAYHHPHLAARSCQMEAAAAPTLYSIRGLWRNERMTDFIRALPGDPVRAAGLEALAEGREPLPPPPATFAERVRTATFRRGQPRPPKVRKASARRSRRRVGEQPMMSL